ncbi:MAG: hypothetical protein ABMA13_10145 [Chthoniobacteraceae bacterium]
MWRQHTLVARLCIKRTIWRETKEERGSHKTIRRILVGLSDGEFRLARGLGGTYPKHFDNDRKHLDVLVKAGLIVAESPAGKTMDFGYCVVRC